MTIKGLLLTAVFLISVFMLAMSSTDMHGVKRYDCTMSEISPDYPVEVKNACRRLQAERNK